MTEYYRDLVPDDIKAVVVEGPSVVVCAAVEQAILVPAAMFDTREEALADMRRRNLQHPENLYALGPSVDGRSFSLSADRTSIRVTRFSRRVAVWNGLYERNITSGIFRQIKERIKK